MVSGDSGKGGKFMRPIFNEFHLLPLRITINLVNKLTSSLCQNISNVTEKCPFRLNRFNGTEVMK